MFEIICKDGRGRVSLNLEALLPCGSGDFKRILSFISLSADPAAKAAELFQFIESRYEDLKKCKEESPAESRKKAITEEIQKLLSNAAILSKEYGTKELKEGNAEKISFKPSCVYRIGLHNGKKAVEQLSGWTFAKNGYSFGLYKEEHDKKTSYTVILYGFKVAEGTTRKAAVDSIDQVFDVLEKNAGKLQEAKEMYENAMIEAGFMERLEIIPDNEEEKTMYAFTKDSITCSGKTFPAEYKESNTGSVLVFAIVGTKENGRKEKKKIIFEPSNEYYQAAAAAAGIVTNTDISRISTEPERLENIPEEVQEPEKEPVKEPDPVKKEDPKAARGPIPEKTFIGSTINGNGWKVFFDPATQRTRIIFDNKPTPEALKVLENAGFYYSRVMNSWNKKLTFKAYRAAKILSDELATIYAA